MTIKDYLGESQQEPLGIDLNGDELLLLDWALQHPEHQVTIALEEHMAWADFRLRVWRAISAFSRAPHLQTIPLALSQDEAEKLLALLPATHRWGGGEDCGYSLKLKVARYLLGEQDGGEVTDASASANPAKDNAES